MNVVIEEGKVMQVFFQKYPADLDELTAIKMIHKVIGSAEDKCKSKDENYLNDLAKVYEMIEVFFGEKSINPASLL